MIVLSPEIVREILEVLYRPALRQRFPQLAPPPLEQVLALIEEAEVVEPRGEVKVCRDPGDDKFFACALAGDAEYIVSEDNDILAVESYEGVKTVRITDFIALLAAG
ncbi:MAG: putative toxin-antitoxin system toxin component, PIN family [Dehalococcoidia bacterium]